MLDETLIARITAEVLRQMKDGACAENPAAPPSLTPRLTVTDGALPDLTAPEMKAQITLDHPENPQLLAQMKKKTSARIGVGCAGPRLKTQTYLTLRADHAGARDAVFRVVDEDLLRELGLFSLQTKSHQAEQREY